MQQPKPWQRRQNGRWSIKLDGRQVSLGRDNSAAFREYHRIMADRQSAPRRSRWPWLPRPEASLN